MDDVQSSSTATKDEALAGLPPLLAAAAGLLDATAEALATATEEVVAPRTELEEEDDELTR